MAPDDQQPHRPAADDHDGGLAADLPRLLGRRRALTLLGGAGLVTLAAACGSSSDTASSAASSSSSSGGSSTSTTATSTTSTAAAAATDVSEIPDETGGPYPGDGSNGPNVLTESGVVREDITTNFGSYSGAAAGVPLTVQLRLVDVAGGAVPLAGAAVYLWHCDQDGNYSLYTAKNANYLRGVQAAGSDGLVTFTSIYPGCYSGRWPHIHFEIYKDLATATAAGTKLKTTQLALPEDACAEAYTASGYASSVTNLGRVSLASDNVFRDGWASELATVTGDPTKGYTAALTVGV
jgi:protocatechuate 3,4-dioxygenase beta subunit